MFNYYQRTLNINKNTKKIKEPLNLFEVKLKFLEKIALEEILSQEVKTSTSLLELETLEFCSYLDQSHQRELPSQYAPADYWTDQRLGFLKSFPD